MFLFFLAGSSGVSASFPFFFFFIYFYEQGPPLEQATTLLHVAECQVSVLCHIAANAKMWEGNEKRPNEKSELSSVVMQLLEIMRDLI